MNLLSLLDKMEIVSLQYQIARKKAEQIIQVNNLPSSFCGEDYAITGDYFENLKEFKIESVEEKISADDLSELHDARNESEGEAKNYLDYLYVKYRLNKKEHRISIRDGSINKLIK